MIAVIQHGTTEMPTEAEKLVSRHREPDTITLGRQSADKAAFKAGTHLEGYPAMPVVERERTQDGPVYQFRLTLEGIEDPQQWFIETDFVESTPEEGWDELARNVFTRQPKHKWFQKGAQLIDAYTGKVVAGFEYMWVMDRQERKHRAAAYFDVAMALRGLRGDKPFKRRYNSTPQTLSPGVFEGLTILNYEAYKNFPPEPDGYASLSGTDLNIQYDQPQTSITDVLVSTSPPPTNKFPAFWTPKDPPVVLGVGSGGGSETITWHIPWGWKILNFQSEQLAGQLIWIHSLTWGNQAATTVG